MRKTDPSALGRGALALSALLSCSPSLAWAQDYIVTIGGRVGEAPPYEGADHDVLSPSVILNVRRADHPRRFTPPDGGTSAALLATRHLDFGPVVRFRYERGDTGKLEGFEKINFAAEPGVFVNVWPTDWLRGRVEARHGFFGYDGYVGDAGIDVIHTGRRWDFSIGPRIGYGDEHYMDTYFGVTPEEADRSPFIKTPYEPGAGQRYAGLETAYSYHLNDHWRTIVDFGYHRLAHRAADSPLVEIAGSRDQYSASVGFSYSFGIHVGKKSGPAS
jgi:outer membrane scaffolding protein for murein synthesis (MipA/OmpV family)